MSSLDGLLLCIAVHLLYGFYLESFNRTVAIGALQWIAMQGATQARDDEAAAEERRRIERLQRQRKERRARRMAEWVTELRIMEDDDFVNVFRISSELLEYIAPVMALPMSHFVEKLGILLDLCVLIPIKYFASAMTFIDLGLYFGLPKTIMHRIVEAFLVHFPRRFKKSWVRFPTAEEMAEMASDFKEVRGLPNVVGAIDGTHIEIRGMENHRQEYYNRKSVYSTQLQVTCDSKGIVWDYTVGHPGSMHDQGIFQQSELHARLERGDLGPYQIVGDAAYPLRSYCLTPVNATRRRLMKSWEQTYNYIHSATRMVVERTIVRPAQAEEAVWEAHASCLPEEPPPVAP
ncbi:unnamed protein product [Closterium sp. Naga37s-1]|nr:unnamed protein product [Closterium sp. Naga37s-1]